MESDRGNVYDKRTDYRSIEKSSIRRIIETEKFLKLSRFVVDNITTNQNSELYLKYETDPRWDDNYDFAEMIAYDMFNEMTMNIERDVAKTLFRVRPIPKIVVKPTVKVVSSNTTNGENAAN